MAVIFYLLGWIGILVGAGWAGYTLFQGIQNVVSAPSSQSMISGIIDYLTNFGLLSASPGLWTLFSGLLLLAVGGILSRLSEIAYNTRNG
jgi:hypothetical protein